MTCATPDQPQGAEDTSGYGGHPPATLREAELSLREWRGAPRAGHPQLLRTEPGALGEPAQRADRAGHASDGALPHGTPEARGGGEHRARATGDSPGTPGLSDGAFATSDERYRAIRHFLASAESAGLTHAELEGRLKIDGFELLRQLFQDHLDLRAGREERLGPLTGADGVSYHSVEADHRRGLVTIFGEVRVARLAYRHKGAANLHPADAALNLPEESYSHGLRALVATEAARGSFEEAVAAIGRGSAAKVGKRQVEALAQAAAVDVEAFFDQVERPAAQADEVVVVSADGKGIVMRPEGLRAATAAKAAASTTKVKGRLSKGEKANRKRWPRSEPSTPSTWPVAVDP